jgi:hypothetical protein
MTSKFAGRESFVWWFGVVEDRDDPMQLGRVRVRVHNFHTEDQSTLPTNDLQWATVLQQITSAASGGVGQSPTGIAVGSTVFGFFADAKEHQIPIVMGTLAGIPQDHDVSSLARGTNTITIDKVGPEPDQAYAAKYPYNKVQQTESGHIIEVDDTPSNERLRTYHKSGTYSEINSVGQRVDKIIGDNFEIDVKNKTLYVGGGFDIHVVGDTNIKVDGNLSANVGGNIDVNAVGNIKVNGTLVEVQCPATFDQLVTFKEGFTLNGTGGGDGNININGDVVAGGISLIKHPHGGVQSGPSKTTPALPS